MESLKFLMVTTHYPPHHLGGDAVFVEYLSRELLRRGHEVHIFHSPIAYRLVRNSKHSLHQIEQDGQPIIHSHNPSASEMDPMMALMFNHSSKATSELGVLVKDIKPDIVHWHNTKGFIGQPVDSRGGLSLYTAHDYYSVCGRSDLTRPDGTICKLPRMCQFCHLSACKPPPIWRLGARRVIRFPKDMTIISPSDFAARKLREDGVETTRVVRNFVPIPPSQVDDGGENRLEIMYLGRLERHKGLVTLVRAFSESRRQQGFRLRLIGEGRYRANLESLIATHGLGSRVMLLGFVSTDELESIRRGIAAQVIPSEWFENAPLAALEGLARGTPMIGSNIGGIPEILTRDAGASTFEPGNVTALGSLLVELWEQRDSLQSLRKASRRAYENRYTPEIHIKNYMDTIRDSSGD